MALLAVATLLAVVALLALGTAVACWVFSNMVLSPRVNCTVQHHVYCDSPAQVQLAFDEVALTTSDGVRLTAGPAGARAILIAGRPLNEPIAQYGPFVMNTREELMTAVEDFQAGRLA